MTDVRAFRWWLVSFATVGLFVGVHRIRGQNRPDAPEEPAKPYKLPPTTPLSPADELKTIKLMPGYRLELVASEPLVHDPVAMTFDPDGRLWVCEMRGFMRDIDRTGEFEPTGTISVLEDTKGDGVFDKSTIFMTGLVLPRGLCWTTDGLLVAENGHIWICRDSTGGLHCDQKTLICEYTVGNLEHALNGLMPALDNWIYNAKEGIRLRKIDGKWVHEATAPRGQWGITQDDHGYLIYNVNAQLIRGDAVPCYSGNAQITNPLINLVLYNEQHVWPIRPNPGINRGYIPSYLRPDGTMIEANADCGPVVFRGDNLPKELYGNVFINEPAGNLVRRQILTEEGGIKSSHNAYDKAEFIASTDERFRPVNMYNAPDGTLYMIDMYRGLIQYGTFITPYLRKDTLDRGLDKPIGLGRIYRIAHETTKPRNPAPMSKADNVQLIANLSSPNGWTRDMAQQLLVQRNDPSVVPNLKKLAMTGDQPLGRLHALWVLEGLKRADPPCLLALLADKDADVRASAVALSRPIAQRQGDSPFVDKLAALSSDTNKNVRMQLTFTLGLVAGASSDRALEPSLKEAAGNPAMLEAILAGFSGHEADFLSVRIALPAWAKSEPWRVQLLKTTAGLLWRQRQPLAVLRLLDVAGRQPEQQAWQQIELLEGLATPMPARAARGGFGGAGQGPRIVVLPTVPQSLEKMRKSPNADLVASAEKVAKLLNWPGKDGKPLPVLAPLSAEHQALYDIGRKEFMGLCAACHNAGGFGEAGKGPSLIDSPWLDDDQRVVRLVLYGLRGPVNVSGEVFNREGVLEMPGMYNALDDQKIAGILTFVRREWREKGQPIDPQTVKAIRAASAGRTEQWNEKELLEVKTEIPPAK